jgi:hypothetical protein
VNKEGNVEEHGQGGSLLGKTLLDFPQGDFAIAGK